MNPRCSALACRQVICARQTLSIDFLQSFGQHGMIEIGCNDAAVGSHARLDQEGEIGGAGPDIERRPLLG